MTDARFSRDERIFWADAFCAMMYGDPELRSVNAAAFADEAPDTHHALAEAHRILRPGGCLELWVPDFGYLVECYLAYRCGDDWRHQNPDGDPMRWLNGRLFAYGPPQANWHRAVFDRVGLTRQLLAVGFAAVTRLDSPRGYDHGRINLGVAAWKRSE